MNETISLLVEMLASEQRTRISAERREKDLIRALHEKASQPPERPLWDVHSVNAALQRVFHRASKIDAIRLHRALSNSTLKVAKDEVEAWWEYPPNDPRSDDEIRGGEGVS